jgi:ABC-type lipoprotein release transport system permease subunit
LYGVTTTDPAALAGCAVLFIGPALVAALVPTIRALRVDPATGLRAE